MDQCNMAIPRMTGFQAIKTLGIIFLLFFILPTALKAQADKFEAVELELNVPNSAGSRIAIFEDKAGRLTANDVLQAPIFNQFAPANALQLNMEFTSSHFWILLRLKNNTELEDWYITARHPLMDVNVYKISEDGKPLTQKNLDRRSPTSKIQVPAHAESLYLMEIHSAHLVDMEFDILDEDLLDHREIEENIFIALASGGFAAMILYNFLLFLTLRDPSYFYYLLFAMVNAHIGLLAVNFPSGIFGWFGINWWDIVNIYRPLAPLTFVLFSRSFLQTKTYCPRFDRVIRIYLYILFALTSGYFFLPQDLLSSIYNKYFLLSLILLSIASVLRLKQGFKPALVYIQSLGCFVLGIFIYIGAIENVLPANGLTRNMHLLGQAMEMILMSIALANKIKILHREKTRAEVTIQVKSRLLRVIAHDIANPLAVVKGVAFSLSRKQMQPTAMGKILRSVEMIEEIMEFVLKAESFGECHKLSLETVRVREIFERVSFLFQSRAHDKGLTLKLEIDDEDMEIIADKISLTNEVLSNLISNSIKFSSAGGEILVKASMQDDQFMKIVVKDHGIGINAAQLPNIFKSHKNNSSRGTQNEKGTGFGLPLVKSYMTAYGGQIEVESTTFEADPENCGTTFHLFLPHNILPIKKTLPLLKVIRTRVLRKASSRLGLPHG